ncbi:hypothetical protein BS78_05G172900 [Paspalum vaginatum]|nr:hypothetical protein BS78_05G172900 [Paspalum vaginatum]KAJ1275918.1 hypothetical protein BS78_05G172900 [Paspalum vaginatum]
MPASAPPTPSWCASVLLLTRHDDLIEISVGPLSSAADRLLQISRPYASWCWCGCPASVQPSTMLPLTSLRFSCQATLEQPSSPKHV